MGTPQCIWTLNELGTKWVLSPSPPSRFLGAWRFNASKLKEINTNLVARAPASFVSLVPDPQFLCGPAGCASGGGRMECKLFSNWIDGTATTRPTCTKLWYEIVATSTK